MGRGNLVGHTLGQYELKEIIGRGGMAEVYLGYQPTLKRYVAVKVLPAQYGLEEGSIARFIREAEIAASLEHPHIVPIIDFGTQSSINYVVMRLLRGGTLADRLRERRAEGAKPLALGEISTLLTQIGSALDYAHKRQVVHRDIKPNNIMFDTQGTAFLVDFGIAKPLDVAQQVTMPGTSMGTVAYMAPEQWRGEKLTPAIDQYALGLVMYTLVTTQPPFDVPPDAPYALMHKHLHEFPTPVHELRADAPEALSRAIERAIAKRPEERFPTVSAFAQAFEQALAGTAGLKETTGFFTFPLPPKRGIAQVPQTPQPAATYSPPPSATSLQATAPGQLPPATASMTAPARAYGGYGVTPLGGTLPDERPAKRRNRGLLLGILGVVVVALAVVGILLLTQTGGVSEAQQTATASAALAAAKATVDAQVTETLGAAAATAGTVIAQAATVAGSVTAAVSNATDTSTPTVAPTVPIIVLPSSTPTSTPSLTPTQTRDATATARKLAEETATIQAQLTQAAATAIVQVTAVFQTAQAQIFIGLTQTATHWTQTPTPTRTATDTATPQPTATATPTHTPTVTPIPTLLGGGGQRIAFSSDQSGQWQIYTMNSDGTDLRQLTTEGSNDEPFWSPDGEQIAFVSDRDGSRDVYTMRADGSGQKNLTRGPGDDISPVWSPDGGRIAFASNRDGKYGIYVMKADGSEVHKLTGDDDASPSWSGDGGQIVFRSVRDGNWELYVMNADGSGLKRLTENNAFDDRAFYSPDGSMIAFHSTRGAADPAKGDGWELYWMQANGGDQRRIVAVPGTTIVADPFWSPDGTQMLFFADPDKNWDIFVLDLKTQQWRRLTNSPSNERYARWQPAVR